MNVIPHLTFRSRARARGPTPTLVTAQLPGVTLRCCARPVGPARNPVCCGDPAAAPLQPLLTLRPLLRSVQSSGSRSRRTSCCQYASCTPVRQLLGSLPPHMPPMMTRELGTHTHTWGGRGHIARQEGAHLSLTSPIHTHKHGEGGGTRSHRKRNSPSGIPNPREQNHDSGRRRLEAISSPFVEAAVRRSKRLLRRLACYATFVRAFLRARHWFSL